MSRQGHPQRLSALPVVTPSEPESTHSESVLRRLAEGRASAILTFAGQGADSLDELARLHDEVPGCRPLIAAADSALRQLASKQSWRWSGLYDAGFEVSRWVGDPTSRPPADYTTSSAISQPLIFLAQLARHQWLLEQGLDEAIGAGAIVGATGHSQGLMAALLVAQSPGGTIELDRAVDFVRYLAWQGQHMALTWRDRAGAGSADGATPMAAVAGPTTARLQHEIDALNARLPEDRRVCIALHNGRTRNVVSGPARSLQTLERRIHEVARTELEARKAGRFGGSPLEPKWEYLHVSAAFHSPHMAPHMARLADDVADLGIAGVPLWMPVLDPADGAAIDCGSDLVERLVRSQSIEPVRWATTVRKLAAQTDATHALDCGPGVGVARLGAAALRGTGTDVLALAEPSGRDVLLGHGPLARPSLDYRVHAPRLAVAADGRTVVDNRYTRATGMPPVILPGMTPTTADVPIVAAAANAGFTAELAGGGQVSERIFELRIDELDEALDPGRAVVFNALHLDRYLWDLHLGKNGLVQRALRRGAPICGVTISAGIPELDEAVRLLRELDGLGAWLNAFKPGTVAQVDRVLAIARAVPDLTVFVHLEGGRAGGHHSWEDLEQLLLARYYAMRSEENVVLCVGGGIAAEARSTELLTGRWARRHDAPDMPVDAVLLGTVAMACAEATASDAVKRALVEASGTPSWVHAGTASGGVTSGKSQLDADIHYLDNNAARCGRLLDEVAGDADAVTARRDEIIAALQGTAKPYFGDIAEMSWQTLLERLADLTAIGNHGRYEDGAWPDLSYRHRFALAIRRAEGRLETSATAAAGGDSSNHDVASSPRASLIGDVDAAVEADDPRAVIAALAQRYPAAPHELVHPADMRWFVRTLCRTPGKPVCFVPVIDADVRRWYKSDSLWQAQYAGYGADQVLVIPGPAAVAGITSSDEPVADLLGRFDAALRDDTGAGPEAALPAYAPRTNDWATGSPEGVSYHADGSVALLAVSDEVAPSAWFAHVAARFPGSVSALFAATTLGAGGRRVPNPVRAMATPEPGAVLRVVLDEAGHVASLRFRAPEPWDDEELVLAAQDDGQVQVEVRPRLVPGAPTAPPWRFVARVDAQGDCTVDAGFGPVDRRRFYHHVLFGRDLPVAPLLEPATVRVAVDAERIRAYAAASHAVLGTVPANHVFTLAWEPLFTVLSCDELVGGIPTLVHLDNSVDVSDAEALAAASHVDVTARVCRVADGADGRTIATECLVEIEGERVAEMRSRFFVRGGADTVDGCVWADERLDATITLDDVAAVEFLLDHEWFTLADGVALSSGDRLDVECSLREEPTDVGRVRGATGVVTRADAVVGRIAFEQQGRTGIHPVRALVEVLGPDGDAVASTPRKTLAREDLVAPADGRPWADVSRDLNPIHTSRLFARSAGLDEPIIHGMWTAACAHAFVVRDVASGVASRVRDYSASFLAPLLGGETLRLRAVRVGVAGGDLRIEVSGVVERDGAEVPVIRATATLLAPRTAYIFPGQGVQRQGMGMDGYARSAAARAVWDRADRYTRRHLGASILDVVRENPQTLPVGDTVYRHPAGVLHLTQFTQVAMATLANAQVAEMRETGVLTHDAIACGHSVGEYNAISAIVGVLPIEELLATVWQRGLTMHDLVPRDDAGESPYAMGVVRPHHAGLGHADAESLVAEVAANTGRFIEIVNYNVRGRQYAVTGEKEALRELAGHLERQRRPGAKPPWVDVPGIDVPFHSSRLRDGVAAFRDTLCRTLPEEGPYLGLVGHYVPNLVARVFSLDREFVEAIAECTESEVIATLLADFSSALETPLRVARTLLIELLAWQFASPVQWIDSQDLLLEPIEAGGLGVERVIEVGVGYQPTAANMMRATSALREARGQRAAELVLNAEADIEEVLHGDEDVESAADEAPKAVAAAVAVTAGATADPDASRAAAAGEAASAEPGAADAMAAESMAADEAKHDVASPAGSGRGAATAEPEAPAEDAPLSVARALRGLLAVQAKVRPDQIADGESIDELFEGVSSRRNQALLDIGAEFQLGAIDGAHELSISDLAAEIGRRAPRWNGPGKYLRATEDESIRRAFGRASIGRKELADAIGQRFGIGPGLTETVILQLALDLRPGDSARGGSIGALPGAEAASRDDVTELIDAAAASLSASSGLRIAPVVRADDAGGGAVDSRVVQELQDRILGPDGVLVHGLSELAARVGHRIVPAVDPRQPLTDVDPRDARLTAIDAEQGSDWDEMVAPRFDARKHVAFTSGWASAQCDVARLYHDVIGGRLELAAAEAEAARLSLHAGEARVAEAARWFATQAGQIADDVGDDDRGAALAALLHGVATGDGAPPPVHPVRPVVDVTADGTPVYREQPSDAPEAISAMLDVLWKSEASPRVEAAGTDRTAALREALTNSEAAPFGFGGRVALVTGASPGSIAVEVVAQLLRGGACVVATTTTYNAERLRFYRALHQRNAAPGAELHVVPFNQASNRDIEALVEWLCTETTEQDGPAVRLLKPALVPDLFVPFAAVKDLATVDTLGSRAEIVLRAMLLSVERMVGAIASRVAASPRPGRRCHTLLPLSPNHGTFGGDGMYGETKAGLEVLCNKWVSERDAWPASTTLCAATIGWVRGTGLMDANNLLAPGLEERSGVRTFSSGEMGWMLAALCAEWARDAAAEAPLRADLSGGLGQVADLRGIVDGVRAELDAASRTPRRRAALDAAEADLIGATPSAPSVVSPLAAWPQEWERPPAPRRPAPSRSVDGVRLEDVVVIVGAGEIGPHGSARTRLAVERLVPGERLASPAVLELAWTCGLVRFESTDRGGEWIDIESGDAVDETEIGERYHDAVLARSGIRFMEPEVVGFGPEAVPVYTKAWLDRDFTFDVGSEDEARSFVAADPEHTSAAFDREAERWTVTRRAGTEVRVPREVQLSRRVAGAVPTGFDLSRYGIPADMIESTDRLSLFNLIATVDAFLSAGLTPEELLSWVHPAKVANTQGSGIGGMRSLRRLYLDHVLGEERQGDVLQETLINVIAGYVVQSYVGSYGSMSHPVGACATAAVSLESGMEKILARKADVVVAGGFDDVGLEGTIGFGDMNATCDTDRMLGMGLAPNQMSRPNDTRRRGFVEAQGGGTILLARGDVALRMGLPVHGVLAYAGSFGDGIQKSVPAPGMGVLACAMGGASSPLGEALARHGLAADDIALVYKHDTSTGANDPNENALHERIQTALGRTEGNPLYIVSQKALTGHSKGGAAAWQTIGLCQALVSGIVPGNRNLDCVDSAMRSYGHLAFTDTPIHTAPGALRAGLATSLGFGHVSVLTMVLHPETFEALVPASELEQWRARVADRARWADAQRAAILVGERVAFEKRTDRRFVAADGTAEQADEEAALLLDPDALLSLETGRFTGEVMS